MLTHVSFQLVSFVELLSTSLMITLEESQHLKTNILHCRFAEKQLPYMKVVFLELLDVGCMVLCDRILLTMTQLMPGELMLSVETLVTVSTGKWFLRLK